MRLLVLVYAAIVGAAVGSFLNVCITRWPEKLSVVRPRSRCPRCEKGIAWYDNIPVVSWLVLRGRCRGCGLPISPLYPTVELATALIWFASAYWFGATFLALRLAIFATILLGVAVTDLRTYTIPDGFTVTGFVFLIAASLVGLFLDAQYPFVGPLSAILGACTGAGAIAIVGWLGEAALKKEAMGFGDVTLMAFIGAAIGPELSLLTVFVGATLGALAFLGLVFPVAKLRGRELPQVPFGVFLAPAALVTLLYGRRIIDLYLAYLAGA
ncbi:MAG: prepilin peptidase [Gemmatimonadaceae bacterium]|nr:prepilin peptidase [Gemmatimonadaceae bacterium]